MLNLWTIESENRTLTIGCEAAREQREYSIFSGMRYQDRQTSEEGYVGIHVSVSVTSETSLQVCKHMVVTSRVTLRSLTHYQP